MTTLHLIILLFAIVGTIAAIAFALLHHSYKPNCPDCAAKSQDPII